MRDARGERRVLAAENDAIARFIVISVDSKRSRSSFPSAEAARERAPRRILLARAVVAFGRRTSGPIDRRLAGGDSAPVIRALTLLY